MLVEGLGIIAMVSALFADNPEADIVYSAELRAHGETMSRRHAAATSLAALVGQIRAWGLDLSGAYPAHIPADDSDEFIVVSLELVPGLNIDFHKESPDIFEPNPHFSAEEAAQVESLLNR
jgi:hypothetical protein